MGGMPRQNDDKTESGDLENRLEWRVGFPGMCEVSSHCNRRRYRTNQAPDLSVIPDAGWKNPSLYLRRRSPPSFHKGSKLTRAHTRHITRISTGGIIGS